ncbi:phosphotransferase [Streptomyces rugosispiralis]|uniref:Hydroxylysine kinase n=1 Tax=Streptomyces rugosispiralis TaxID=2967341 RepID=A0ABT1UPN0_9ACTN|nr:phosphotransferase [Streptomyces rugosispiralis]MCQ8186936.1 phosphotransferase [Streptomyces rugosispiralis]
MPEGDFQPLPPLLTDAEIVRTAHAGFDVTVDRLTRLGGETATNAKVVLADGTACMFKAVAARTTAHVEAVAALLEWRSSLVAAAARAGLPVARARTAPRGGTVAVVEDRGRFLLIQLSAWLPGTALAHHPVAGSAALRVRRSLGAGAARLRQAFTSHPAPPRANDHEWSFETTGTVISDTLADPGVRSRMGRAGLEAVEAVVSRFEGLAEAVRQAPRGVTHHDLNDFNVLIGVTPEGPGVTGVIDFDDARTGPLVAEAAIASAYAMLGQRDPVSALVEVARGLADVEPLSEQEARLLLPGSAARLALNATLWTARAGAHNSAYGAQRMKRTWPALHTLASADWDAADARVIEAATVPQRAAA